MAEPIADRPGAQPPQLLVRIAEPARRGGVAGITLRLQRLDPRCLARRPLLEQRHRFLRRDEVGDVAEVDQPDDLGRAHIGDQLPQRLAGLLGQQVPHRVDDRARGKMDHTLFRADPAQLAVARHMPPEARAVLADPVEVEPDDQRRQRLDRRAANLIAAPDGEGQAMAAQPCIVRVEDAVSGRIIGVGIHRIRPVEHQRGGEAEVDNPDAGDGRHARARYAGRRSLQYLIRPLPGRPASPCPTRCFVRG